LFGCGGGGGAFIGFSLLNSLYSASLVGYCMTIYGGFMHVLYYHQMQKGHATVERRVKPYV